MAEPIWDRMNADHRERFGVLLAPLIAASRTKDYETKEKATVQLHTWMISMSDVPEVILTEAIANLVNAGVTFMPKPGEVKAACAAVVAKKRKAVREHFLSACTHDSHWIDGPNGSVSRCPCWVGLQKALEQVEKPIALPPSREDAMELGQ